MRVEIRGDELVSEVVRARVTRRLGFALSRFGARIATVRVRLGDLNGPRGGIDKCCRIVVVGDRAWRLVVEDRDADLHAVIDRAAERAGRAVSRALDRQRTDRAPGGRVGEGGEGYDGTAPDDQ